MTREEEVREAIDKTFPCINGGRCYEQSIGASGFELGARWADENPNLSSLWHDGSEEPKENTDILFISKKGKVHKVSKVDDWFYDWISENGGIKRWVYINDLLPKE